MVRFLNFRHSLFIPFFFLAPVLTYKIMRAKIFFLKGFAELHIEPFSTTSFGINFELEMNLRHSHHFASCFFFVVVFAINTGRAPN